MRPVPLGHKEPAPPVESSVPSWSVSTTTSATAATEGLSGFGRRAYPATSAPGGPVYGTATATGRSCGSRATLRPVAARGISAITRAIRAPYRL